MPFPDERDRELIRVAEEAESLAGTLSEWASAFNPQRRSKMVGALTEEEEFELLELRRKAEHLSRSAGVPAAAAVFGPSQSGKSLFIGQILRPKDEEFSPLGRDESLGEPAYFSKLSFTSDLNPQCGANEATSLVTRFTTKDRLRADTPPHTPVMVLTLSRTDWLRVLARGFHAECAWDPKNRWSADTIEGVLAELARNPAFQAPKIDRLWRLDLVDAFDAMRSEDGQRFAARGAELGGLLARYPLSEEGYISLASRLFWEGWPGLTNLYRKVAQFIAQLSPEAASGKSSISSSRPAMFSHWAGVRFLLDSQRIAKQTRPGSLHKLFQELNWSDFRLVRESGWVVLDHQPGHGGPPLDLDILQASLLEMVVPVLPERVNDEWRDVLQNIDLLDVPGMRAGRGGSEQGRRTSADDPREQFEIVKRGKVLHLFDRYVDELQVQTLLLLVRGGNLEVRGPINRAINRWGKARYGASWGRVPDQVPALIVGLTGIDEEFRTRLDYANETLYELRLEQLVDTLPVMKNFDGAGRAFDNVFPVRYPGTLDANATQRQADGLKKWLTAKDAFLKSQQVRRHVRDPERRWDSAMSDVDGGLSLIASAFLNLTTAVGKREQLNRELKALNGRLRALTLGWIVSQDVNQERERRRTSARAVIDWLRHPDDYESRVRVLHQSLTIQEGDVPPLADLEDLPTTKAGEPRQKRLRIALEQFLGRWLSEQVPVRWSQAGGTASGFDDSGFLQFARHLVDYLRSKAVFTELNGILERVIFLDLQNEDARKHARRRYAQMVLNDFVFNPGPSIPVWSPPKAEAGGEGGEGAALSPAEWPLGLQQPFLDRWEARLENILADGAGNASVLPPGNDELIKLALDHGVIDVVPA